MHAFIMILVIMIIEKFYYFWKQDFRIGYKNIKGSFTLNTKNIIVVNSFLLKYYFITLLMY